MVWINVDYNTELVWQNVVLFVIFHTLNLALDSSLASSIIRFIQQTKNKNNDILCSQSAYL